jgi:transposase
VRVPVRAERPKLIRQRAQLPLDTPSDITTAAIYTLQPLARRILNLTDQVNDLKLKISQVLLDHYGSRVSRRVDTGS